MRSASAAVDWCTPRAGAAGLCLRTASKIGHTLPQYRPPHSLVCGSSPGYTRFGNATAPERVAHPLSKVVQPHPWAPGQPCDRALSHGTVLSNMCSRHVHPPVPTCSRANSPRSPFPSHSRTDDLHGRVHASSLSCPTSSNRAVPSCSAPHPPC